MISRSILNLATFFLHDVKWTLLDLAVDIPHILTQDAQNKQLDATEEEESSRCQSVARNGKTVK